jgi:hypothetical protein
MLVDATEWLEDHMSVIGLDMLSCWRLMLRMLKWDWERSLGESEGPLIGKGGKSDVESWDLQGGSLSLCQLWTDVLAPVSKY